MPTARNFFTPQEQELIVQAIAKAEQQTSGEIRLHMENICFGNELSRAEKVFHQLKMHETQERNGILIYLAVLSRKVAVIGDKGIHEQLGQTFWQEIVNGLIEKFRSDRRAEALCDSIIKCGEQLGKFFPRSENDQNELPNTISYK